MESCGITDGCYSPKFGVRQCKAVIHYIWQTANRGHGLRQTGLLAVTREAAEVLAEAQAGYCVTPGNDVEIRDAILKLMAGPEVDSRMGKSGREYVGEHFDRDRSARQLIDLPDILISNQRGRRGVNEP